jgi:hypothetical protein
MRITFLKKVFKYISESIPCYDNSKLHILSENIRILKNETKYFKKFPAPNYILRKLVMTITYYIYIYIYIYIYTHTHTHTHTHTQGSRERERGREKERETEAKGQGPNIPFKGTPQMT